MSFDLLGSLGASSPGRPAPQCSRKGCRNNAAWALRWNNPRVHTPERRKIWLACNDHREWLGDYLATRGFLKDVVPFTELGQDQDQDPHTSTSSQE